MFVKVFTDGRPRQDVVPLGLGREGAAPKAGVRPTFVEFMQTPAAGEMHNIMNSQPTREKGRKKDGKALQPPTSHLLRPSEVEEAGNE